MPRALDQATEEFTPLATVATAYPFGANANISLLKSIFRLADMIEEISNKVGETYEIQAGDFAGDANVGDNLLFVAYRTDGLGNTTYYELQSERSLWQLLSTNNLSLANDTHNVAFTSAIDYSTGADGSAEVEYTQGFGIIHPTGTVMETDEFNLFLPVM